MFENCLLFALFRVPLTLIVLQEKQAAKAESEEGEEDDEGAQQAQETLDLLNESKQENNGKAIGLRITPFLMFLN